MSTGEGSFHAGGVWAVLDGGRGLLDPLVEQPLVALLESNRAQWDAEDRARAALESDEVAKLKVRIDRLNSGRVELVLQLDRALHALLAPLPAAPPCTETPGSVCDRLTILHLRLAYAGAAAHEGDAAVAARLPQILAQATQLCRAFDLMLDDVRAGMRSFFVFEPNKLYGAPAYVT